MKNKIHVAMRGWTDGSKFLLADKNHSDEEVQDIADVVGTSTELLNWVADHHSRYSSIYVVSEPEVVYSMRQSRPELSIIDIDADIDAGDYNG